jgi:hypothetical protein
MQFWTNAGDSIGERMVIDQDGNVGIGQTSPEGLLSFDASDSNTPKIRFQNAAGVTGDAALSTYEDSLGTTLMIGSNLITGAGGSIARFNTGEESCGIQFNRTGVIQFYTGGTGATATVTANIDTSGNFTTTAGITVGAGINFPDSQAASADANTLDDYEEGTWTAVLTPGSGTITMASQTLTYTKIGRAVTLCGIMGTSGESSAGGGLSITGLPFTCKDAGDQVKTSTCTGFTTCTHNSTESNCSTNFCICQSLTSHSYSATARSKNRSPSPFLIIIKSICISTCGLRIWKINTSTNSYSSSSCKIT